MRGFSYRDEAGAAHHNHGRPRCTQAGFEALPIPDLALVEVHGRLVTKPAMTQWGCPFDCEFCSVTAMFSRRARHRRTDQVLAELAGLGAKRVFFHDDNLVVNSARTTGLLEAMLAAGITPPWFAQVRADAALRSPAHAEPDHDFVELMREAGWQMVMIGIEAITDEALHGIGKRQREGHVEVAVAALHDNDIAVHGMFVAGLDTDTAGSAVDTAAFAGRLGVDTFQLMIETPLPGTRLWERAVAEGRLLSHDWSLFDGHHAVMRPRQMSALGLELSVLEAMRRFYSWPAIVASGVTSALSLLPDLTAAVAHPDLGRRLRVLARLASARRWEEISSLVERSFADPARSRLGHATWAPPCASVLAASSPPGGSRTAPVST